MGLRRELKERDRNVCILAKGMRFRLSASSIIGKRKNIIIQISRMKGISTLQLFALQHYSKVQNIPKIKLAQQF